MLYNDYMTVSSMAFAPERASFGRAQSFVLRLGWLPKACQAVSADPEIFFGDKAIAELGVGKNMVTAIRHWAHAADVLDFHGKKAMLTDFGQYIFGDNGADPYLEDESTLWLLHWKIVSRPQFFTAGFWLFNKFHKPFFVADEVVRVLCEEMKGYKSGAESIKRDVDTTLRMYSHRRLSSVDEDALATPFPALGLLVYDEANKAYHCELDKRESLPAAVVGYAVAEWLVAADKKEMSLRAAADSAATGASVGASLRLTEEGLLDKLSAISELHPSYKLSEVAGDWHLLFMGDTPNPTDFLDILYNSHGHCQRKNNH